MKIEKGSVMKKEAEFATTEAAHPTGVLRGRILGTVVCQHLDRTVDLIRADEYVKIAVISRSRPLVYHVRQYWPFENEPTYARLPEHAMHESHVSHRAEVLASDPAPNRPNEVFSARRPHVDGEHGQYAMLDRSFGPQSRGWRRWRWNGCSDRSYGGVHVLVAYVQASYGPLDSSTQYAPHPANLHGTLTRLAQHETSRHIPEQPNAPTADRPELATI